MYEPQLSKRLTDIITGDQTYIRFYGYPTKRFNKKWAYDNKSHPTVLRPDFGDRKKLFTTFFNYGGPLSVVVTLGKKTMTSAHYTGTVLL